MITRFFKSDAANAMLAFNTLDRDYHPLPNLLRVIERPGASYCRRIIVNGSRPYIH